ncbi:hypothetical protein SISSUDRAFT_830922 [Sistotremastrum suecicum HHB10207 ss-3]|uniref:C2 domain-containing protein n=1 Tax=Sistotremastrum suecicum HHB10207 ss-3 TaxID=1314776 RepID=A0A166CNA3_9AGAM|nr:hypothetical protein SISSUDRAFT_830922 [Sistotremastrum suecicum HHB10207 ss-3]
MSSSLKEIGTLIIVVLKARNLPNKRHIGKQDPYCTVEFNKDKRRTKAIRRGGQHPEWDQEIRFTVFEDDSEEPAPTDSDTPPPLPPKKSKERRIKGGKELQMGCYADDPREPELIGETTVDLSEVFSKGETDEWFTLMNKEKYSGEVYLELTFWSNEKPPQKKSSPKNGSNNANYGGPGSFTPSEDPSLRYHAHRHPSQGMSPSRIPTSLSASPLSTRPRSSTVRPSSSLANLDLYSPPYESGAGSPARYPQSDVDSLTHSMAELGVGGGSRRRGSYPPRFDDPNASSGFRLGSPSSSLSHHPESVGYHEFTEPLSSHSSMSSMHSYQSAESYSSRGGSIPSYGSRTFQRDSFSAPPEFYPPSQEAPWDSQYSVDYPNRPPTGFISSPSATPMASHYPGSRPLPTPYVQTPPRPPTTVSSIPQSLSSSYSASTLYTPPRPLSSQTPIPFGYSLPPSLLPGPPASAPPPHNTTQTNNISPPIIRRALSFRLHLHRLYLNLLLALDRYRTQWRRQQTNKVRVASLQHLIYSKVFPLPAVMDTCQRVHSRTWDLLPLCQTEDQLHRSLRTLLFLHRHLRRYWQVPSVRRSSQGHPRLCLPGKDVRVLDPFLSLLRRLPYHIPRLLSRPTHCIQHLHHSRPHMLTPPNLIMALRHHG